MSSPIIIDNNNDVFLSPHPHKSIVYNNNIKYSISHSKSNNDDLFLNIYSTSSGVWNKELIINIIDSINTDTSPDLLSNFSMHWLDDKLYILFPAKFNHETNSDTSRWLMQYLIVDPLTWTYTFKTISDVFTMLPFEGPIKFDSIQKLDKIYCAFNYGENEILGSINQSIAFATITSSSCDSVRVYQQREDIYEIRLDYSDNDDILYMNYTGEKNNLIYRLVPNIKLIDNQFDLDEVHLVTRMTEFLGFNAYIGFTKSSPRNISIHNTYFIPVSEDAKKLSFSFVKHFLVLSYFTQGRVKYIKFNLNDKTFISHDLLYNDTAFSQFRDDGTDLEQETLVLHMVSDKFYEMRIDIDIASPLLITPISKKVELDTIIEHIFEAPEEIEGNYLNFNLSIATPTENRIDLKSDNQNVDGVKWEYNPSGDHITWINYPETGSNDCFGKKIKVSIDRKLLI